jgi:hypothetical protein
MPPICILRGDVMVVMPAIIAPAAYRDPSALLRRNGRGCGLLGGGDHGGRAARARVLDRAHEVLAGIL